MKKPLNHLTFLYGKDKAPQLPHNKFGKGLVKTRIVDGASASVDNDGRPLPEAKRLKEILKSRSGGKA